MASLFQTRRSLGATLVVVLGCWLLGGQSVQAGCGDHGYIVQRNNGDVVVVTPSNPKCPCKGPKCHKPEMPAGPMVPTAPPLVPVDEALNQVITNNCLILAVHQEFCFCAAPPHGGHPDEILHPPRN